MTDAETSGKIMEGRYEVALRRPATATQSEVETKKSSTPPPSEWVWDDSPAARSAATAVTAKGREVRFHLEYSSGTAAIRGTKPLIEGQHYWEILMQSAVYGTDMMVGLGTPSVQMDKYRNQFCSFLGIDDESWGLSYTGRLYHGGRSRSFTSKFSQGTVIGLHLDMWRGTLTLYKNRQNLGVAYSGLQGKVLFPMVCSTAARSSMKILHAVYFPSSLQFLCCETIRRIIPKQLDVTEVMRMPPGLRSFLHNNLEWLLKPSISCDRVLELRKEKLDKANSLMDQVQATLNEVNDRLNDQSPSDSYEDSCDATPDFAFDGQTPNHISDEETEPWPQRPCRIPLFDDERYSPDIDHSQFSDEEDQENDNEDEDEDDNDDDRYSPRKKMKITKPSNEEEVEIELELESPAFEKDSINDEKKLKFKHIWQMEPVPLTTPWTKTDSVQDEASSDSARPSPHTDGPL